MTYVLMFCYMASWVLQKSIWMSGQGANVPKSYAMFAWSDFFRFDLMSVWKHPYYYQIKHPYYYQIKHPQYSNHPKKSPKKTHQTHWVFRWSKIHQNRSAEDSFVSSIFKGFRVGSTGRRGAPLPQGFLGWGVLGCPRKLGKALVNVL